MSFPSCCRVLLTLGSAGGGGAKSEDRKSKLKIKNQRLNEQRKRKALEDAKVAKGAPDAKKSKGAPEAKKAKKSSGAKKPAPNAPDENSGIHPSRMKRIQDN
jgi:nucleolar protein 6